MKPENQSSFSYYWRFVVLLVTTLYWIHSFCGFLLLSTIATQIQPQHRWPRAWVIPLLAVLFFVFLSLTVWLSRKWNQKFWLRIRLSQLLIVSAILPFLALQSIKAPEIISQTIKKEESNPQFPTSYHVVTKTNSPHFYRKNQVGWTFNDHFDEDGGDHQEKLNKIRQDALNDTFFYRYWGSDDYVSGIILMMAITVLFCFYLPNIFTGKLR